MGFTKAVALNPEHVCQLLYAGTFKFVIDTDNYICVLKDQRNNIENEQ